MGFWSGGGAALLKTGQTTQYGGYADDGNLQKGVAKAYSILTTAQHSGTVNIDMQALATATDISFTAATKRISQVAAGMAVIKTNDIVVVTGSASNNGTFTVTTGNTAGYCVVSETIVDEAVGASVVIKKREALSNNCVLDLSTGLMFWRTIPTKFGSASNGQIPWTTDAAGQGVFALKDLANAGNLGGYADWRVPNILEIQSLFAVAAGATGPNSTAFPTWSGAGVSYWSSTTRPDVTTSALAFYSGGGYSLAVAKTSNCYGSPLVRG